MGGSDCFCDDLFLPWAGRNPIYGIVENVRSLFNVGAIFRTADGVRAAGVYLTGFTGRPPRKEVARVALGAEAAVSWRYVNRTVDAIGLLRRRGVQVVALEKVCGSKDFRSLDWTFPTAFVVGHEVEGVRPETLSRCDEVAHLPMLGAKTSLNVSVAAGIAFYHLLALKESQRGPGR